ncbi:MAG TPA: hypothetical protein VKZ53_24080, partial [Candidatus Angelobacter sp.]|nr:hypothetical protein [Candidatus Angelobacter sp.]
MRDGAPAPTVIPTPEGAHHDKEAKLQEEAKAQGVDVETIVHRLIARFPVQQPTIGARLLAEPEDAPDRQDRQPHPFEPIPDRRHGAYPGGGHVDGGDSRSA